MLGKYKNLVDDVYRYVVVDAYPTGIIPIRYLNDLLANHRPREFKAVIVESGPGG